VLLKLLITDQGVAYENLVQDLSEKEFYMSDYVPKIEMNLPKKVWLLDTTLRDGEQMPGVTYTIDEKILIAHQLDELRVPKIEAGFPITSRGETEAVKKIANLGLDSTIVALARPLKSDIDRALDCDVPYVHIFISTSDLHIEHMMNTTREEVMRQTVEGIEYAKDHGVRVEYSPQDATRTDMGFLKEICVAASDAGAEMLNIPDTVLRVLQGAKEDRGHPAQRPRPQRPRPGDSQQPGRGGGWCRADTRLRQRPRREGGQHRPRGSGAEPGSPVQGRDGA
jgi:hypothetical protein